MRNLLKKLGVFSLSIGLVFVGLTSLTACGSNHYCDQCGDKASWKAQETFLGEPMGSAVYVCTACKRDGKGPHPFTGNSIKWTHL